MRNLKGAFVMLVIATILVAGSAMAGDWQKLGKKTLVFSNKAKTSSISTKGIAVSQIAFKVTGGWVRLSEITLNFDDGSTQKIEEFENPSPDTRSDSIAVDGGPKTLTSIDFSSRAVSSATQGRATVMALGQ